MIIQKDKIVYSYLEEPLYIPRQFKTGEQYSWLVKGYFNIVTAANRTVSSDYGDIWIFPKIEVIRFHSLTPQMEDYYIKFIDQRIIDLEKKVIRLAEPKDEERHYWKASVYPIAQEEIKDVCRQLKLEYTEA